MTGLRMDDLRVKYLTRKTPALDDVTLDVAAGDIVGVFGRTGAGKSTLCLAAAGFIPRVVRARVDGKVAIGDTSLIEASLADVAGKVAIVFSSPALQLSSSKPTVRQELAFGLENLAVPRAEMDARIDGVLARLGIQHLADREPLALSGGEQQRVAIASVVVMGTDVLVLDEPAAQLDPQGTAEVTALLRELAGDGRAVLVAEQAVEVLTAAQRCLVLNDGRIVASAPPGEALGSGTLGPVGLASPTLVVLAEAAGLAAERAFDEEAIAEALKGGVDKRPVSDEPALPIIEDGGKPLAIAMRGVAHTYPGGVEALRSIDLNIEPGESLAIVGQNGSGKTTLIKHLIGLLRAQSGVVEIGGRSVADRLVSDLAAEVGFVFQNPDQQLFNSRVDREVGFGPRNLRLPAAEVDRRVDNALALVGLVDERATNPYDLGYSLRKLVALASVLAMRPSVLVLDEPTTGQDGPGVRRVGSIVDAAAAAGHTVIAVTHDMEFAARHFARVVVMRHGEIVLDGPPSTVFASGNEDLMATTGIRPPPAARIAARLGLAAAPADAAALLAML